LTVRNILVECADLPDIRVLCVKELLVSVDNHSIIDFIKETHLYHRL